MYSYRHNTFTSFVQTSARRRRGKPHSQLAIVCTDKTFIDRAAQYFNSPRKNRRVVSYRQKKLNQLSGRKVQKLVPQPVARAILVLNYTQRAEQSCIEAEPTREALATGSTKFPGSILPLYANFAKVLAGGPETNFGQFIAGDACGSLMKFATAAWKVADQVTSADVAVERSKVPNKGPTG
jgi:hypothetical protein